MGKPICALCRRLTHISYIHGGMCARRPLIFLHPLLEGVKTPPVETQHPPPAFSVIISFFNVNVDFARVYTPQTFVYTPPQCQIPRDNPEDVWHKTGAMAPQPARKPRINVLTTLNMDS